jgi:mannose-1-phosphate guanylyltransferase / mannose-6-phosphate isomerase
MPLVDIVPVVLCGGSGSRLWPLSRAGFPKQFLALTGAETLFQQAVRRLADAIPANEATVGAPLVVCNEEHRFLVTEQARELSCSDVTMLLEPAGRNTAPALTLAALQASSAGRDPVLLVAPADQAIGNETAFAQALRHAAMRAAEGTVVVLGVPPTRPETGYGYIHAPSAATTNSHSPSSHVTVAKFVEKPSAELAERYISSGEYFWNAGLFVLKASTWLAALEAFRPDILAATRKAWDARKTDGQFVRPDKDAFLAAPADSVDYAVMERCPGGPFAVEMVPLEAGWSDLGAWDAVWEALPKDADGNASVGDVITTGARNSLVHANSRLVAVVGLSDIAVIETADSVLVTSRSRSQEVKKVVEALQAQNREEYTLHRKVHRPWGWYDSVDEGGRFKVKHIQVKPKASLSLQLHHHRAEHWVVVSGTAEVINGDQTLILTENQSTYIPLGAKHRLTNPGTVPLEIVEVQSGSYLGEDDIVRFDDTYGRVS